MSCEASGVDHLDLLDECGLILGDEHMKRFWITDSVIQDGWFAKLDFAVKKRLVESRNRLSSGVVRGLRVKVTANVVAASDLKRWLEKNSKK